MAVTAESSPDRTLFTTVLGKPEQLFHKRSCLIHVKNRVH